MNYKIVSDSSCNVFSLPGVAFESVPMKICAQNREYVDDEQLNVAEMVEEMRHHTGRSGSSCPNIGEWITAFEGADAIFALAITSQLSGSCSAAMQAADAYRAAHPKAKVCVLDTLSTGPEMLLIMEKLCQYISEGMEFEAIEEKIRAYMRHTHLIFALKSLTNLARNGRVSPAAAAFAGALGICVIGRASDDGVLQQLHKCRGDKKALKCIVAEMKALGYSGGRVRVSHCQNPELSSALVEMLRAEFPEMDAQIGACGALCSFYAEKGGFMLGFEDEGALAF